MNLLLLLVIICVVMAATTPSKTQFEENVPDKFVNMKARIVKKPVYLDYGIITTTF